MSESPMKPKHKPVAAGCMMSIQDAPIILTSFSMYFTFIGYGAVIGAVSAAIPALADTFDMSETTLGWVYTARGLGYFCGASCTGIILEFNYLKISKEHFLSIFILIVAALMVLMSVCTNFLLILIEIFFVGLCFGVFDMTCNVLLPELWGLRVGPWMQALHACFGVGAMIGPTLVGATDYQVSFIIIAIIFGIPLISLNIKDLIGAAVVNNDTDNVMVEDGNVGMDVAVDENKMGVEVGVGSEQLPEMKINGNKQDDVTMDMDVNENKLVELIVPVSIRAMFFIYYLVYAGIEVGFFGWIATYALATVTTSESMAAYLVSLFFVSLTFGRLLAIPLAAYVPNQHMLRFQFGITILASILSIVIMPISYATACIVTCVMGYGVSSLFPLGLTIPQDYGFEVNSKVISFCVMGATIGETVIPFLVGLIMGNTGAKAMPYCVTGFVLILVIDYCMIHFALKKEQLAYRNGDFSHIVNIKNESSGLNLNINKSEYELELNIIPKNELTFNNHI